MAILLLSLFPPDTFPSTFSNTFSEYEKSDFVQLSSITIRRPHPSLKSIEFINLRIVVGDSILQKYAQKKEIVESNPATQHHKGDHNNTL